MRRTAFVPIASLSILAIVPGCGGGGGDAMVNVPAEAAALDAQMKTGMTRLTAMVSNVETGLVFVLNPAAGLAPGVSVQPDAGAGVPPYSVRFSGSYDGNGDGIDETTMEGRATFRSDPDTDWTGMDGQLTLDIKIPVVGHLYHGDIAYAITSADRRLSGSGTFTNPLNGNTTTLAVPASTPLVIRPATGAADAQSNACGYSIDGSASVQVAGSSGTLRSTWVFASNRTSVAVTGASFTDSGGQTTAIDDTSVDLRCGGSGRIEDWVASYDQRWACLPRESGRATITIAVAGADSLTITDEDPPGSGSSKTYPAAIVGVSPHAVRGSFPGGDAVNVYREDFTWTLGKNGASYSQISTYAYTQGPLIGKGGICVATARRR